jgi:HEAT repeat protein
MPILRLTLLTGMCLLAVPGWAQNGVFGGAGQPFGQQPVASNQEGAPEVDTSPLRRQLLEHSQRGEMQLADAISSLARTGRWSDVDRLLPQAASTDITVLAGIAHRIGPAMLLRMKQNEQLGDAARASIGRLEKAAIEYAESRDRLRGAIDQLDNPSVDARLDAARVLLGGGNVAISELVAASVSDDPPAPRDEILRTMLQFGPGGTEALRQLALYATPPVRDRALQALGRVDRNSHIADFVTGMYAADASPAEVATATAHLKRVGGELPSHGSAVEFLADEFEGRQHDAQLTDNNGQQTTTWNVNPDRTGVTFQPTGLMVNAYRRAVDAGSRLRRVGGLAPQTRQSVLAADLAYRVVIDVDWGDEDQLAAMRAAYGNSLTPSSLSSAVGQSTRAGEHAATIGLVRLIASQSSAADRDVLLTGSGPLTTPLVNAASSPDPRVRYEAALAVSQLAGGPHRYPGSSRVMHCLSEMRSLGDRPTAILVETRPDVVLHLEALLRDIGFKVEVVPTVAQLQRLVARGGDFRMILSKTELADLPAIEMIDLVRRLDRGREVPIVLFGADPGEIIRARRWPAPTVLIDRPVSVAAFVGLLDAAAERRRLPALSIIDRQRYREAATAFLDQLAEAR